MRSTSRLLTSASRSPAKRSRQRNARPRLQWLEGRDVPATFTVTNLSDGAVTAAGQLPGSLRQAIFDANSNPGADDIQFNSVYGTITLTNELSISDAVTVNSDYYPSELTISGGNSVRVFNTSAAPAGATIKLRGLVITNGKTAGSGAGIYGVDESLELYKCQVKGNTAAMDGGGIYIQSGQLDISNSTINDNRVTGAGNDGGAINVQGNGQVELYNSTVSGNTADGDGGAIYFNNGGTLSLENCCLSGNVALTDDGGGIYLFATTATIRNSTISGNSAAAAGQDGGGIALAGTANLTMRNSTAAFNSALGSGGGVAVISGKLTTESTLIAKNTCPGSPDVKNAVTTTTSFIGSTTGSTPTGSPMTGDPLIGPLANNGGTTLTHALLTGSPAIDAGSLSVYSFLDQRLDGYQGLFYRSVGQTDIGAFEFQHVFNVTNLNDSGPGSLRQAIYDASITKGADTLQFSHITGGTVQLTTGELAINDPVSIRAYRNITISGNSVSRVFNTTGAPAGTAITFYGLTIANGKTAGSGGGILAGDESITLDSATVTNNTATGDGGGIYINNGALFIYFSQVANNAVTGAGNDGGGISVLGATAVEVQYSTISGNTAHGDGGGMYFANGGTLQMTYSTASGNVAQTDDGGGLYLFATTATIRNSTLSGNSAVAAGQDGGGIVLLGTANLTMRNTTVAFNSALGSGGGVAVISSKLTTESTIIAKNTCPGSPDVKNAVATTTSLIGDLTGSTPSGSPMTGDPLLGTLANNGGFTQTHALSILSPAVGKGSKTAAELYDNRGPGYGRARGSVDIGAVEAHTDFVVLNANESGAGSLRQAFKDANDFRGADTIRFDTGFFNIPRTITLTTGELYATESATIVGPGAGLLTVSGNNAFRVMVLDSDYNDTSETADYTVSGMTITKGLAAENDYYGSGGGIGAFGDSLTIQNCVITGNSAFGYGGGVSGVNLTMIDSQVTNNTAKNAGGVNSFGNVSITRSSVSGNVATSAWGGVYVNGALQLIDSTVASNTSSTHGGGIALWGNASHFIRNSTISSNTANQGGGIALGFDSTFTFDGTLIVQNSTITNNKANPSGGGIARAFGAGKIELESSIVSNNLGATGPDIQSGGTVSAKKSAIGSSAGFTLTDQGGNLPFGTNLKLGALANNGGTTLTHNPATDSPLVNAGSNPFGLALDQRGVNRNLSGAPDIGSVEVTGVPDNSVPTIAKITSTPSSGTFQAGGTVTVTLQFSEPVTLSGYLFVFFDSGGSMVIQGPQTAATLSGVYTVGANQNSPDLNVTAVALDNTSSLVDSSGNKAALSLPANNNLANNSAIVIGTPVASTFTVTNTKDDTNPGSLRRAVMDANASPGYDVIVFDASFDTAKTITLGSQLDISEAVAITGKGASLTTIQGGGSNRLVLTQNAQAGAAINISGLTFNGGNAGNGGGIFIGDESVTLTNTVLSNNKTSGLGGAITVQAGGTIKLIASTLTGNTASFGGGISIFNGNAEIRDSSLINNTATNNQGGALYFSGTVGSGGLRLVNSTVSGNKAATYGGGIGLRHFNGKFEALSSTIVNNTSSYLGGGISRNDSGTGTIFLRSTIVSGNSATVGGHDLYSTTTVDAFFSAIGKSGGFTLTTSNGFNLDYGTNLKLGALAANGGPTLTHRPAGDSPLLDAGTNYYNVGTDQRGSGFPRQINSSPDIGAVEVPIVLSTVVLNANDSGAGSLRQAILNANTNPGADTISFDPTFFATPRTVTLTGGQMAFTDTTGATTVTGPGLSLVTVTGNNASRVFHVSSGVTVSLTGATIAGGNSADGGGIYNIGTLTIGNARFTGNKSSVGGAIRNDGTFNVSNSTFDSNTANTGEGFGGAIATFGNMVLSGCTFTGNQSSVLGGAIVANGNAVISDSTFTNNSSGVGGALRFHGTVTVTGSTLNGNSAKDGGGIANYGTLNVGNTQLDGNSAVSGGGAIGNYNNGNLTFSGGTVTNNTAFSGGGMLLTGTVAINNTQFTSNKANYGGAIKNDAMLTITNGKFDQNTALTGDGQGGAIWNNAPMTVTQCDFTANHSVYGGAVFSPSGTNVANSTFTNNAANINGGAMWLLNTSIVAGSTFSNNSAVNAGGAIVSHGNTTISNSTVAGNTAGTGGGIHFNTGSGTMKNVTIAYNAANYYGGGIVVDNIVVTTTNTVVAGNASPNQANVWGTLNASSSNNLLNLSAAAAGLSTLASNGGPTQTIALLPGSPAINAGTTAGVPTTDQRGLSRVGMPDIGAFELQTPVPPPTATVKIDSGTGQRSMIRSITVTFSEPVTLGANPFTVMRLATSTNPSPAGNVILAIAGSGSTYTITFNDATYAPAVGSAKSLIDGKYSITLNASAITSVGSFQQFDGNGNGTGGDSTTTLFHRLFGDVRGSSTADLSGNGFTDNVDLLAFRAANGSNSTSANWNPAFDSNGDGFIDNVDFVQFRMRVGMTA